MTDRAAPIYPVTRGDFTTASFGPTPSQTVGPYWHIGLLWEDGPDVVSASTPGRISIAITVIDGGGEPVADAMIETWQADATGGFAGAPDRFAGDMDGFRGFARSAADASGTATVNTVKPAPLPAESDLVEAPHINVSIFARGMLDRLVTRMYFPEDASAHRLDPVLTTMPPHERSKLIATRDGDGYRWTVRVQDTDPLGRETPFFEV
ncbi:protocatechuate 3,4-dioxygenase subunit alpha [Gordonia sp. zg691]|uniref:protocatechuate 3,4-dioxygenase subunit alpha n=1 Tax=Gordonia jinghuaiqii TaxID=2758710 RepID=UPI001662375B|nr:protocatechuate 3,4-dioxygenase subunit alpha [Gordonia jinghuaiqii]MBD0863038.1 protocatechuate 3,4-dioxygenase subunit alpha [Gordonia jinghuaiqii]